MRQKLTWSLICQFAFLCVLALPARGAAPANNPAAAPAQPTEPKTADSPPAIPKAAESKPDDGGIPGLVRLAKDYDLWIDPKRKLVVVEGQVCLREGQLELFACPRGTKEHESLVSINCKPQFVHAALLAVGAKPGAPVQWDPYKPATGTPVEITVLWVTEDGAKHKARAQDWIKEAKTGKAMEQAWVFTGSRVWTDPETKETYYSADGGDFICVSNFSSAMLDLPIKSSQSNAELMFTAFTEHIPPLKTKVRLVLMPKSDQPAGEPGKDAAEPQPATGDVDKPAAEPTPTAAAEKSAPAAPPK